MKFLNLLRVLSIWALMPVFISAMLAITLCLVVLYVFSIIAINVFLFISIYWWYWPYVIFINLISGTFKDCVREIFEPVVEIPATLILEPSSKKLFLDIYKTVKNVLSKAVNMVKSLKAKDE